MTHRLTKDEFGKLKPVIVAELAAVIENKLRQMGDDVSQQWRPAKTQSVSFWCHTCNRQRQRSRIDGKCPFCRPAG